MIKETLTRRDILKLGLTGAAISCLTGRCSNESGPNPAEPPGPRPVYQLSDGKSLYDDFDGNGGLQTYNNQNLAVAGQLSSKLWVPGFGKDIVDHPATGFITVVDENRQRVEYGFQKDQSQEIRYVYDAEGKCIDAVPHVRGQPYHSRRQLLWLGLKDGSYVTDAGRVVVQKGRAYGIAEVAPNAGSGYVLKMTNSYPDVGLMDSVFLMLDHPNIIEFAVYKSFSADVMLSSASTGQIISAILDYHTTIPEQPPGMSWHATIGIRRKAWGDVILFAQAKNVNTGYLYYNVMANAGFDRWYNVRLDIITSIDDSALEDHELRLDFYVDGALMASEIPEDSELLLDAQRTGNGPQRSLQVIKGQDEGTGMAYFDNIRAVYKDRVS